MIALLLAKGKNRNLGGTYFSVRKQEKDFFWAKRVEGYLYSDLRPTMTQTNKICLSYV
jgi:hypothetical protein